MWVTDALLPMCFLLHQAVARCTPSFAGKTYEVASGFNGPWPYSKPVDVITSTLTEVPERLRGKVYFTSEAPLEHLQTMAGYGIKRVYVDGGTLITSLLREDAVDVMTLTIGQCRWISLGTELLALCARNVLRL